MKIKIIHASATVAALMAVCAVLLAPFTQRARAQSTELVVLSSDGMKPAIQALVPKIERTIGQRIAVHFDASKRLVQRIETGEPFDVAILSSNTMEAVIGLGKIAADTGQNVARTGIGVGIRAGAHKPDIGTPEALRRTLLNAKSIGYDQDGASAAAVEKLLATLGIAEAVRSKTVLGHEPGRAQMNVAAGKVEMVITLLPEIPPFKGVELAGPLPAELQSYIYFTAGISARAHNPEAARALIQFVAGPAAAPVLKEKGLETR